jgi:hypothetical protein
VHCLPSEQQNIARDGTVLVLSDDGFGDVWRYAHDGEYPIRGTTKSQT